MIDRSRLALFLAPRLWLGGAIGIALWLAWIISVVTGGGTYDRFGQLVCTDHLAFYSAARMIRDGRAGEIYDLPTIAYVQVELVGDRWHGKYEAYRNPPFYALLYSPTVRLPYLTSAFLWFGLSILTTVAAVVLILRRVELEAIGWAMCFPPTFFALTYGQNTPLSLLILAITYRMMAADRLLPAGMVAGLLVFKPTLLIGLAVWALFDFRRLGKCAIGVVMTVTVLVGGSYALIPEAWNGFRESLVSNASFDQMDWWKNLTPRAFWRVLVGANRLATVLWILTVLPVLPGAWFTVRRFRDHPQRVPILFALSIPLTLWLSPHALIYEWQLYLIPAMILATSLPSHRERWLLLFAGIFLLSLVGPPLTQVQLMGLPWALHLVVPIAGWIGYMAMKWAAEPALPLEAVSPSQQNGMSHRNGQSIP